MIYEFQVRADEYSSKVERLMLAALRRAGARVPTVDGSVTVSQLVAASGQCGTDLLDWFPRR